MVRLHVVVEGQTEESFVNNILAPELWMHDTVTDVHRITTGRRRGRPYRGGFVDYEHLRRDIALWTRQDARADARFTTMVDFYRLPLNFPQHAECKRVVDPFARVQCLEAALYDDIGDPRFLPYVQLYEFEALLLSAPAAFASVFPERPEAIAELERVGRNYSTPELIDDGEDTCPSRRILGVLADYDKVAHGTLIARSVGIMSMRAACRRFDSWVAQLETLTRTS